MPSRSRSRTNHPSTSFPLVVWRAVFRLRPRSTIPRSEMRNSVERNWHLMLPRQARMPTSALVRGVAFPHHPAQRIDGADPLFARLRAGGARPIKTGNAVSESENIVVETAEKIFGDLADPQTINHDKDGKWKAPLWNALSEAGLPLSWVPEDCGGSGASLAEGFGVIGAAGRHAIAVPLAETMLAGWLLAQARMSSPEGEMTVAPARPNDRITLNADGTLSGRARSVPFAKSAK